MKRNGEEKSIQFFVTRVAALARAKVPKADELYEARQDLQQARLERDIKREAVKTTGSNLPMDAKRRERLAKMLYPEGFKR